jgi:hypothetical protein
MPGARRTASQLLHLQALAHAHRPGGAAGQVGADLRQAAATGGTLGVGSGGACRAHRSQALEPEPANAAMVG